FFQAEDGIRDLIVTGVQTCALPIFRRLSHSQFSHWNWARNWRWKCGWNWNWKWNWGWNWEWNRESKWDLPSFCVGKDREGRMARSEERRVGKECRWRGGRSK